jgi:hypothetical protein
VGTLARRRRNQVGAFFAQAEGARRIALSVVMDASAGLAAGVLDQGPLALDGEIQICIASFSAIIPP